MSKISFGKEKVCDTTIYKDKTGRSDFIVRRQLGQQVYLDPKWRKLGYIYSQGRTMSCDNRLLNSQTRPDLLLCHR